MHGYDSGCYDPCGYGQTAPSYGYGYPSQVAGVAAAPVHGAGKGFALIVVLFILLIIVGASKYHC